MLNPPGRAFRDDLGGRSGHLFDTASADSREVERLAAKHDDALLLVRPFGISEHDFERFAAEENRVEAGEEFGVAVRLSAAGRKEIESIIGTGDEAVDAGADENGCTHGGT